MHQSVKKAITVIFVLLIIIFTVLWCGRDMMVQHYIGSKLEQIEKRISSSPRYGVPKTISGANGYAKESCRMMKRK